MGRLRVTTTPAVPGQVTVDGVARDSWALNWVEMAVGDHEVCFGPVPGFSPPPCEQVVVEEGVTTTVDGTYSPRGVMRVMTDPAVPSTVTIDGAPADDWGVWTELDPGTYQVCFGLVEGFDPPPCQDMVVAAGTTVTATGMFTPNESALGPTGHGFIRATTDPAVSARITVDGSVADSWGLEWVKAAPGDHEVCFEGVLYATAPECQVISVTAGAVSEVVGTSVPHGFLRVQTSPPVPATISIDGEPADAWEVWTSLEPGTYDVCYGSVPGLEAPPCEQVAVTAGTTSEVTGGFETGILWVDSGLDAPDDVPGDGYCDVGDGTCTLRAAIDETNAVPGAGTVALAVDVTLSLAGAGEDANGTGDLDVTDELTVIGAGHTVDAAGLDRVFHHHAGQLELEVLTVTGGAADTGAGIAAVAPLALTGATVTANQATTAGGGVWSTGSSLALTDTTVSENQALVGGVPYQDDCGFGEQDGGTGGGVWVDGVDTSITSTSIDANHAGHSGGGLTAIGGTLTVESTQVTGNLADGYAWSIGFECSPEEWTGTGGGLELVGVDTAVTTSTVGGNRAGYGGGMYVTGGILGVDGSAIAANTARGQIADSQGREDRGDGGGLHLDSVDATVSDTTVDSNTAAEDGGGIYQLAGVLALSDSVVDANTANGELYWECGFDECGDDITNLSTRGDGGGIFTTGSTTVERTSVTGNESSLTGAGVHSVGDVALREALVSGNRAYGFVSQTVSPGSGSYYEERGRGGGLAAPAGSVVARNVTIADNEARVEGGGVWSGTTVTGTLLTVAANEGGGLAGTGTYTLGGSLLAPQTSGANCAAPVSSSGWNLSSDSTCGLADASDAEGVDPLLGPLADHGGPTPTMLPSGLSLAVDAVPVATPGLCDGTLVIDQRGLPRPSGAGCDIGAVERQPGDP